MASVNKVILVGNLGKDPEIRYAESGDAICNMTVATSESWKDKATGEKKEKTEWHRISMFGKLAEIAGEYLKKGSQVYLEGKLQTRKWQNKEGQDQYTTEVVCDQMKMLGGRPEGGRSDAPHSEGQTRKEAPKQTGGFADFDEDIPFDNPYRGIRSMVV